MTHIDNPPVISGAYFILSGLGRDNLFIAYACCDIISRAKDENQHTWRSITPFIKILSVNLHVDQMWIRRKTIVELREFQEKILTYLYK